MAALPPLLAYEAAIAPDSFRVEPADDGVVLLLPPWPTAVILSRLVTAVLFVVVTGAALALALLVGWVLPLRDGPDGVEFKHRYGLPMFMSVFLAAALYNLILNVRRLNAQRSGGRAAREVHIRPVSPMGHRPAATSVTWSVKVVWWPSWVGRLWGVQVRSEVSQNRWRLKEIEVGTRRAQAETVVAELRRALGSPPAARRTPPDGPS
jgi:hypothetical protein